MTAWHLGFFTGAGADGNSVLIKPVSLVAVNLSCRKRISYLLFQLFQLGLCFRVSAAFRQVVGKAPGYNIGGRFGKITEFPVEGEDVILESFQFEQAVGDLHMGR